MNTWEIRGILERIDRAVTPEAVQESAVEAIRAIEKYVKLRLDRMVESAFELGVWYPERLAPKNLPLLVHYYDADAERGGFAVAYKLDGGSWKMTPSYGESIFLNVTMWMRLPELQTTKDDAE